MWPHPWLQRRRRRRLTNYTNRRRTQTNKIQVFIFYVISHEVVVVVAGHEVKLVMTTEAEAAHAPPSRRNSVMYQRGEATRIFWEKSEEGLVPGAQVCRTEICSYHRRVDKRAIHIARVARESQLHRFIFNWHPSFQLSSIHSSLMVMESPYPLLRVGLWMFSVHDEVRKRRSAYKWGTGLFKLGNVSRYGKRWRKLSSLVERKTSWTPLLRSWIKSPQSKRWSKGRVQEIHDARQAGVVHDNDILLL